MENELALIIVKQDSKILIGESEVFEQGYILTNYVNIQFAQTGHQSMGLMDLTYPVPFLEYMVTGEALERPLTFIKKDVYYYKQEEINKETIDWYRRVRAKKSGIEISNTLPKSLILEGK